MPESDSDDVPLIQRVKAHPAPPPRAAPAPAARAAPPASASGLVKRKPVTSPAPPSKKPRAEVPPAAKKTVAPAASKPKPKPKPKPAAEEEEDEDEEEEDAFLKRLLHSKPGAKKMWQTLSHQGVTFPPAYEPHGVKILYNGVPVNLSPAEEEAATLFASMKGTDYAGKKVFVANFFKSFRTILSSTNRQLIVEFAKCNFDDIYNHVEAEREKKKSLTSEEKKKLKIDRDAAELPYTTCTIDGRVEKVGNFRVEPPGLFRGRGEHPKMGLIKKRIQPEDVIINIGKEAVPPPAPAGHRWKAVIHKQEVSWLAGWKDSINTKDWKYVQLAATSLIKGQSDQSKFEKARELKRHVETIRADYKRNMQSTDVTVAQLAVTTYLVDKLALRAGGEKDDDLADTVGVCTLRVGHVTCQPPHLLKFDFLGKDSIRYLQEHEVLPQVYDAIKTFSKGKGAEDNLFDQITPDKVNKHLQTLMPGLTIKVFRTYNASITLSRLLKMTNTDLSVLEKKKEYDNANKEVAILCNHQKGVNKNHDTSMAKHAEKKAALEEELEGASGAAAARLREKIEKLEATMESKESLKTVSLGTSKINYLDPRITVAWCKKHEVPIEKMYTKVLIAKFTWAMETEPSWDF